LPGPVRGGGGGWLGGGGFGGGVGGGTGGIDVSRVAVAPSS
jgi:hypothetical protein